MDVLYVGSLKSRVDRHIPHDAKKKCVTRLCGTCKEQIVLVGKSLRRAENAAILAGVKVMLICNECVKKGTPDGRPIDAEAFFNDPELASQLARHRAEMN